MKYVSCNLLRTKNKILMQFNRSVNLKIYKSEPCETKK